MNVLWNLVLSLLLLIGIATAFTSNSHEVSSGVSCRRNAFNLPVARSNVQDDVSLAFDDDDNEDYDDDEPSSRKSKLSPRWEQLDPKYRQYLIKKGQERAIANKQKRQNQQTLKRKRLLFIRDAQRKKKQASKVSRKIPFSQRTPLSELEVGAEVDGTVISLTHFGVYVDIGTECDGLLHISQLSVDDFVEHPRQLFQPGDDVTVRIRSFSADRKKLHLTMLPLEVLQEEQLEAQTAQDRIPLEEIQVDDELWGQVKRVTDFGGYVEVGAVVDGWLHFMDHPSWDGTMHPSEFMKRGDRVRVWVSDVDRAQKRLKLTAHRPNHLPGPRREFL